MATQQKFTFKLSKKYGEAERFAIGQEVIDFIIERSSKGKDKKNRDFKGYSDSYKASFDFKKAGKKGAKKAVKGKRVAKKAAKKVAKKTSRGRGKGRGRGKK